MLHIVRLCRIVSHVLGKCKKKLILKTAEFRIAIRDFFFTYQIIVNSSLSIIPNLSHFTQLCPKIDANLNNIIVHIGTHFTYNLY